MQRSSKTEQPFIIITDATEFGDDGVAIAMMLTHSKIDVKLIVCTSGNVWADEVFGNVKKLLQRLGKSQVPVCTYSPDPAQFDRALQSLTEHPNGKHGYIGALSKPFPPRSTARDESSELRKAIEKDPGIGLLVLGPPSPIASLRRESPDVIGRLGPVFMMGGAVHVSGNATTYAEFNFWFDAEATEALVSADLDITLLPQDVATRLSYPAKIPYRLPPPPPIDYLREYLAHRKGSKTPLGVWDEAMSATVLRSSLIESTLRSEIQVVTLGPQAGRLKLTNGLQRRKIKIITAVDQKQTIRFILESLS